MVPLTRKCIGGSKYFSLIGILRIRREYVNLVWYIWLWKISHCIEGVSNQNLHFYIILHLSLSWVTIMHKKMISLNCLIWGIDCFLPPLFGNSKKHCVTAVYPIGNLDPIHFTFFLPSWVTLIHQNMMLLNSPVEGNDCYWLPFCMNLYKMRYHTS